MIAVARHALLGRHARPPSRWRQALRWVLLGLALLGWIHSGHPVVIPARRSRRASQPIHRAG